MRRSSMDLPVPPKDTDLRNIIDKLAQFVARNGPEFEQMTKSKQKNNPKFGFLYGGEHFNYYQYKVTTEQAILKQSGRRETGWRPEEPSTASITAAALEAIAARQTAMREQIEQSEANLNAQHAVLVQRQQSQTEETVAKAQNETIHRLAAEANVRLPEFDAVLQPIIDSCTKDSISSGKGWILSHSNAREAGTLMSQYLLKKVTTPGSSFTQKLHIIYLVNDVLHHCARKNAEHLKKSLETVVVPMFCNASIAITEEQETKLNKLLKLWESKSNYFDQSVIDKMKDPTNSYQEYTAGLISQYANLIAPLTQQTKLTFENYQKQHQAFVAHTMQQIQQLEMQKQIIEQQMPAPPTGTENSLQNPMQNPLPPPPSMNFNIPPFGDQGFNPPPPAPLMATQIPPPYEQQPYQPSGMSAFQRNEPPGNYGIQNASNGNQSNKSESGPYDFETGVNQNPNVVSNKIGASEESIPNINLSQPPPGFFEGPPSPAFHNGMPDLSKPPPGFSAPPAPEIVCPDDLLPSVPYYELPAGLMVPLIMLEDSEYKPLDPDAIKLPPPAPPSDRLLAAVRAFYAAPNHTRPQDSEGWEKLGLYEYYKAKNSARKQKEDDINMGIRQKSKSPSPIQLDHFHIKSLPTRRYRSKSRSLSRERENSRSKSPPARRSPSPDRSEHGINNRRANRRTRRSPTNSSPPQSQSPGRPYNRRSSPDQEGSDNFHHKNDRVIRSPPQTIDPSGAVPLSELDSSNKGHQMLRKMGWTQGAGLGATGQGITTPVSAKDKDSRDINMSDPYENFRKNKGAAFISRMKERALERST